MSSPSTKKFSGIFVSYRREDSAGHAGRLFDRLVQHFGRERIFMDIDTIEPGEDFVTVIENAVSSCDVLIAVIGQNWLSTGGTGRLAKPNDFVRIEIATALRRDIRVIPVLVQRARIPKPQDLPEDLAKLTRRNAVELSDLRWQSDVDQLIAVMERVLTKRAEEDEAVAEQGVEGVPVYESKLDAPATLVTTPTTRPIYKNRKLMMISGAVLIVLLAATIMLWRSQRDQSSINDFNQTAAASPSVTEQPASATPTPSPEEPKKPPVEIAMVFVPAGSFVMGDEAIGAAPLREVTFSEGFYMGKYEVTQAQWQEVMGENPSSFNDCDNCPVEAVSWVEVQSFLQKLNERNGSFRYRLPSEAEWEYACRAGTTGSYAGLLDDLAWYSENSESATHPVGTKAPNAFGLYDMHGNVWEWCQDVYYAGYDGAPSDGSARLKDGGPHKRMARGGSWSDSEDSMRLMSAFRGVNPETKREPLVGFRVVAERIN